MHLCTLTNMYIQRDADRFNRIATGFKYNNADVDTVRGSRVEKKRRKGKGEVILVLFTKAKSRLTVY